MVLWVVYNSESLVRLDVNAPNRNIKLSVRTSEKTVNHALEQNQSSCLISPHLGNIVFL